MKQGWEVKKLGEVCNVFNGSTPLKSKKEFWEEGSINWFTIEDMRTQGRYIFETRQKITELGFKNSSLKLLPINSVLICCTASIGEYAIIKTELCTNQQFNGLVVKDEKELNTDFLFYFVSTLKDTLYNLSGKTTIDFISMTKLKLIEIPLPPIQKQQRIVSILDEAFTAIDKAKANTEQNLKNAKELFESEFQRIFSEKGNDWEEKSMDEVCEISSKLIDPKLEEYENLIHIGAGNIESKKEILTDLKTAKEENLISGKFLFDETMVLYSKIRPYLIKVVRCNFKGLCSADIYPLVPLKNNIIKDFLYYLLISNDFTDYAIKGSQRAGMPKVNRNHLFAYTFSLPPIKQQQSIVSKLDVLREQTIKLEAVYAQKLKDLEELKKSVLEKAFSGELN